MPDTSDSLPQAGAPTPSLAGTVILVREMPPWQVLMLRRQQALQFMGGLWVFPGGAADAAETGAANSTPSGSAERIEAARIAASRELMEEARLAVPPRQLVHFAHWITPSRAGRRFDTHFFLAAAPSGQEPRVDTSEASDLQWIEPRELTGRELPIREFPLSAPTLLVLRELEELRQRGSTIAMTLALASDRRILPIMPKLIEDGTLVFPWDPGYPQAPGEGVNWDAATMAERSGWPMRLPAPSVRLKAR